ncbi:hypothetical protein [Engelhardtia mirabilis]|uniref:Alpha/beta hydrolase family protein n=1 Tax=Engelhardtia mirabilis TaxID=2528011 RepID=A0A518BRY1_9BACT|nr:hypothetical protein Pla133_48510 [Planctomycetes bacterium Pla133]QDV04055.1 hypothetical protein Pla86_48490 [Planctomycetes bacterium Pla86]
MLTTIFCLAALAQTTPPQPVHFNWGSDVNEEAWLWEAPGASHLVWYLPGGSWKQGPGGFAPAAMPSILEPLLQAGISVGLSGYDTDDAFPLPELALGGLVTYSRGVLGYGDVTLLGRSAGTHMALFNGLVPSGPDAADRVCAISTPAAFLPAFAPFPSSPVLDHFWAGAQALPQVPTQVQVNASSAYWPLVFPPKPSTRFAIVGMPKALEAPLLPLPLGVLSFGADAHSTWSSQMQAYTMELAGWDVTFLDSWGGGMPLDPVVRAQTWLLSELAPQQP